MSGSSNWLEEQKDLLTRRFERGRDEVIEGIEKELKRRDEEYQKQLKKRDEQHGILSGRYNEEIIKNAYLTEENSRLKRNFERLDQRKSKSKTNTPESGNVPVPGTTSAEETGATISSEEYRHLTEKFNDLHKKHHEATQRLKYLERKNVAVMQKNKEMKESVLAWQKFSDRHNAKNLRMKPEGKSELMETTEQTEENAPPAIPSSPGPSFMRTPRSLVELDRSSPAPISLLSHVEYPPADEPNRIVPHENDIGLHVERASPNHLPEAGHECPKDVEMTKEDRFPHSREQHASSDDKLPSSQTTEDEIITQNAASMMMPPSNVADDDFPQVVSERSLKRKRMGTTKFEVYTDRIRSDGTPTNPFRVKEEPRSSPPPQRSTYQLVRKETLDLDELGPTIISTPHRRLRGDNSTVIGTLRHQRSTSVPLIKEELADENNNREYSTNVAKQLRPDLSGLVTSEARAFSEPFDQIRSGSRPLQPIDANVVAFGHSEERTPNKRQKKEVERQLTTFRMMTESGEEPPPINRKLSKLTPDKARAKFNERVRAEKDGQAPAKITTGVTKTPNTAPPKLNAAQVPTPPSSLTRPTYTPSSRPGCRNGPKAASRPVWPEARKAPAPPPERQPPLRSKPISELKLSDFKANPAYNQGFSYAFAETVRKRGDRACLPGCTRPECCGSTFRSLAAAAPQLSSSQEEAVLEEYLGDAFDTMQLTQMLPEERQELVLQARTRELANKHGRHRQAYERHATPPGFWRVDFPTTQEDEEDKQKAIQLERETVKERRAEALRNGGKWIFRDE